MHHQDQIIFIGDYLFPEGDAASVRTLSLARVCRDLGYAVLVIGKGQLRPEHYRADLGASYIEGIRYETMNPERVSWGQRIRHPIARIRQAASALEAHDLTDVRAVIINASGSARHLPFVSAFCRRHSIPLVGEVCEWYDPCQMTHGRLDPAYIIFTLIFRYGIPRLRNVVAISSLLAGHFEGRERNVIRIPAILDVVSTPCVDRTPADRLVLLYAGMPGRKDLLKEVFVALLALDPDERSRIEFRLLGPTRTELSALLGDSAGLLDQLAGTVKPLGRAPRDQVLEALQEAHFTVLLRPDRRYARAGFPSKVPESLAAGVPVLLTLTGDLREYLGDERASLGVRDCSAGEMSKTIRRALQLGPAQLKELRRQARAKAEEFFDYRHYLDSFGRFLEDVRSEAQGVRYA